MNKQEFTQRVLDSEQMLYRISMSMLGNTADCEDSVQQTILTAYSKLASLKNEEYFRTWLTKILINECRLQLRRRNRVQLLEILPEEDEDNEQQCAELRFAVDKLSEKLRLVLVMKYSEGFTIKEISDSLKIPEGTVKSRLSQAKAALRRELEDEGKTAPIESMSKVI